MTVFNVILFLVSGIGAVAAVQAVAQLASRLGRRKREPRVEFYNAFTAEERATPATVRKDP